MHEKKENKDRRRKEKKREEEKSYGDRKNKGEIRYWEVEEEERINPK